VEDPELLREAQTILIRCGAISYCLEELHKRYKAVRKFLDNLNLDNPSGLINLLDEMAQPVRKMVQLLDPDTERDEIMAVIK
jgi:hypothetical protein